MPVYDYRCDRCTYVLSEIRTVSERDTPLDCPNCLDGMVVRVVSAPNIRVKGGTPKFGKHKKSSQNEL